MGNLSTKALNEMSDAAAHATLDVRAVEVRPLRGRLPPRRAQQEQGQEVRQRPRLLATSLRFAPLAAPSGAASSLREEVGGGDEQDVVLGGLARAARR